MYSRMVSFALQGIDGVPVEVEVDIGAGLPSFEVVGLPSSHGREVRERVRAALRNSGYQFPPRRITVNLARDGGRLEGSGFDLPIALALLAAVGQLEAGQLEGLGAVGELTLEGRLRPVPGALSFALAAKTGVRGLLLPLAMAAAAAMAEGLAVYGASSLGEVVEHLAGRSPLAPVGKPPQRRERPWQIDFSDVRGQPVAKRAVLVAAAGGHNVLLSGPPGAGKSMLLRRLPTILPPLTLAEGLETAKIYSAAGLDRGLSFQPPFRAPHHSASVAALVGGGSPVRPGEVTLAHRGVLFLDEMPEFERAALEALRQPLEDGSVTVARVRGSYTLPAQVLLAGSANPCPCGRADGSCKCGPAQAARYRERLSGPLLDRIDLHFAVQRARLGEGEGGATSAVLRQQVLACRELQAARYREAGFACNAHLPSALLPRYCPVAPAARALLTQAYNVGLLTLRGYDRTVRVARTIADLEKSESIGQEHVEEALQYRSAAGAGLELTG